MKVSCCSLENIASASSRKYSVDRRCFPHEQMGCHQSIADKRYIHEAGLAKWCRSLSQHINDNHTSLPREVRTVAPELCSQDQTQKRRHCPPAVLSWKSSREQPHFHFHLTLPICQIRGWASKTLGILSNIWSMCFLFPRISKSSVSSARFRGRVVSVNVLGKSYSQALLPCNPTRV